MGEDQSQTGRRRVTVAEASEILSISVEAVRGRIKRGTLEHERDSGTVYVLLDTDQPQPDDDQSADQMRPDDAGVLADELRDRIRYLERQVEEEREARRRADTLLAQLMQRIPELEAPTSSSEARESTDSPGPTEMPTPARGEAQEATGRPEPGAQPRSLWSRWRRLLR